MFHGISISGIDELDICYKENMSRGILIVIASGAAHIIKKQLIDMDISEEDITEFTFGNMQINPTPYEFIVKRIHDINITYRLFCDEKSRRVFEGLLKYRISRNTKYLADITDDENEQYFDKEIIHLSDKECFVDCGAFIGDTMCEYAKRTEGEWMAYYGFEADNNVFSQLSLNAEEFRNVELYNIGCWDSHTRLSFDSIGSGSSRIVNIETKDGIEVDSLDHILGNKKVTFIKMDIEGAERKALMGAETIIKKEKPILAISTYHSLEDFIYLPQMMAQLNEEYKIYLRHYRFLSDSETVC